MLGKCSISLGLFHLVLGRLEHEEADQGQRCAAEQEQYDDPHHNTRTKSDVVVVDTPFLAKRVLGKQVHIVTFYADSSLGASGAVVDAGEALASQQGEGGCALGAGVGTAGALLASCDARQALTLV